MAVLVFSYAYVAVVAFWIGPADFTLPLKFSFIWVILILMAQSIDQLRSEVKAKTDTLPGFQALLVLILSIAALYGGARSFLVASAPLSLLSIDTLVRAISTVGLLGPGYFAVLVVQGVLNTYFRRKGDK